MDDFRLRVFITAARTLSFTRTAEQLCISQPAVSKHVGELESRYGLQLFTRRGSRLELTEAGRTLLVSAERVADDYRRLEYEMSLCTGQTEGELRSGALRIVDLEGLTLLRDFVFVHNEAHPARLVRQFLDFVRVGF